MARDADSADATGAVFLQEPDVDEDQLLFTTVEEAGTSLRAVWPYRQWQQLAARTAVGDDAPEQQSSDPGRRRRARWLREVIAAAVAVELRVDLLVTASPDLLASPERSIREASPMTAPQALAVVGLYLRGRGEYPMWAPNVLVFSEHGTLWSATRAQLPSGWRWGSALVAHARSADRDAPSLLAGSLHERIVRVLRYRDQIHRATLVLQDNVTADRATEALDNLMVNLVGAFDAAARAAHASGGLPAKDRRRAGWQSSEWRDRVRKISEPLAELFDTGTEAADLFTACRLLRNTVHGESLQSTSFQAAGRPRETLVALPEDDATDLAMIFDRLGGRDEWGLRTLVGDRMYIDAATFVERLLPQVIALLDEVLRLTPVDRLPGVDSAKLLTAPPEDMSFGRGTRVRASLLLGLPVPSA